MNRTAECWPFRIRSKRRVNLFSHVSSRNPFKACGDRFEAVWKPSCERILSAFAGRVIACQDLRCSGHRFLFTWLLSKAVFVQDRSPYWASLHESGMQFTFMASANSRGCSACSRSRSESFKFSATHTIGRRVRIFTCLQNQFA